LFSFSLSNCHNFIVFAFSLSFSQKYYEMNPAQHTERIQALDQIEQNVYEMMAQASTSLAEFGKDKPSAKSVDTQVQTFLKSVEKVEAGLNKQLQYLFKASTLHPHEGSCYSSAKIKELAQMRAENMRSKLAVMEKTRLEHQAENQRLEAKRAEMRQQAAASQANNQASQQQHQQQPQSMDTAQS